MIWIATLCLLAVTGWLVLNALNERQWVEDHSHDETVAADPGFLPDMGKVSKRVSDVKQQLSLEDDDTKLSRAVSKVQTSTGRVGERLSSVARAARVDESEAVRYQGPTGATLIGAAAAKVGVDTDELGQRVKDKAKSTLESQQRSDALFTKVSDKVSGTVAAGMDKVNRTVKRSDANPTSAVEARENNDDLVNQVADKVDGVVSDIDEKSGSLKA